MLNRSNTTRIAILAAIFAFGGMAAQSENAAGVQLADLPKLMKTKGLMIRHGSTCNTASGWANDTYSGTVTGASVQCFVPSGTERKNENYAKYLNPDRTNDRFYCIASVPGVLKLGAILVQTKVPGSRTQKKNPYHCDLSRVKIKSLVQKFNRVDTQN